MHGAVENDDFEGAMQKVGGQIIAFTSFNNSLLLFFTFTFFISTFHFQFFTFEGAMQKVGGQIIAFISFDNSLSLFRFHFSLFHF